ncbi:MAG: hypothetical protein Q4F81_00510 [Eubacteriales bacterium]|nr:hypothetical protein [Eubacteriales bacterium]
MRKRSNRLWSDCTQALGLETNTEKRWFIAAFLLLFIYLWLCQYLRSFLTYDVTSGIACSILFPALQVLPVCVFGVMLFTKFRITSVSSEDRFPRLRRFFPIIVSALTFGYLLLWLIAYFPGGFSPDSIIQLAQAYYGYFDNWHPVAHTWVFFWIPWKIFHHPAGIVLYQIFLFSLAIGYLYRVLSRRGCPMWFLIASWLFLFLNPQTAEIMMYPWKDCALTIVSLVIFTQVIEIYETQGIWLKKWYHFLPFTILCIMATVFRHNGILLTVPLYIILFIFQKKQRKTVLLSAVLVLFVVWLLNGPLMLWERVCPASNRQLETLGLPLTILSSVYMKDRGALSLEAIRFLDSLATQEEWNTIYQFGSFNSIKFSSSLPLAECVEQEGAKAILQYTAQAFAQSPIWSTKALITLTRQVWDPLANVGGIGTPYCSDIIVDGISVAMHGNEKLAQILTNWGNTTDSLFLSLFTKNVGMMLLISLFAAVANIGRSKLGRAFMVFPMLIYDFGTMLLLTGPDFRFFHFNFVIIVPLLYLIMSGSKNNEAETTA